MLPGKALPELYQTQLDKKIRHIESEFSCFNIPEPEIFASPPKHFRMRAEFKVWQQENIAAYAMYEAGKYKKPVIIEEFSIGSTVITELMPGLMNEINAHDVLRKRLFQIEFLSSSTGEILCTLIYHKALEEEWSQKASLLREKFGCSIIGRSRKQKLILGKDYVYENFFIADEMFRYQQVEASFTQPNAAVCQHMLSWATRHSQNLGGDLLELYCGNANFTLPLSRNFAKVLATEISKSSVKSAIHNIELNNIKNIEVVRLSSEEFTQAINKVRPFRRLQHLELEDYNFSTIFVDPPRAGMDEDSCELAASFDNIVYISCNPETLKANLRVLCKSHVISKFAVFDQFPYTNHIECGAILKRR